VKIKMGCVMKKVILLCGLLFSLGVNAELVGNGGFEASWDPSTNRGPGYVYSPNEPGLDWSFGSGSGLSETGTAWSGSAQSGNQFAFIQRGGVFWQSVTVTERSNLNLAYFISARPGYPIAHDVLVSFAGVQVQSVHATTTSWRRISFDLGAVDAGVYTLKFTGSPRTNADLTTFVDDVSLTSTLVEYQSKLGAESAFAVNGNGGFATLLIGAAFWRRKRLLNA
jgi:hypothetical protein